MTEPQKRRPRTPVENPPPQPPVRSQEEQIERTARAPAVTGETEEAPPTDEERE